MCSDLLIVWTRDPVWIMLCSCSNAWFKFSVLTSDLMLSNLMLSKESVYWKSNQILQERGKKKFVYVFAFVVIITPNKTQNHWFILYIVFKLFCLTKTLASLYLKVCCVVEWTNWPMTSPASNLSSRKSSRSTSTWPGCRLALWGPLLQGYRDKKDTRMAMMQSALWDPLVHGQETGQPGGIH